MEYHHRLLSSEINTGRLNVKERDIIEDITSLEWFKKHSKKSVAVFKSDGSLINRSIRISLSQKGTGWRFACGGADTFKGCRSSDMVLIKGADGKIEITITENSPKEPLPIQPLLEHRPLSESYIPILSYATYNLYATCNLAQCAHETFFEEAEIKRCIRAIERKKQAILYGSPGTGKTFVPNWR